MSERPRATRPVLLVLLGVGAVLIGALLRIRATLSLDGFDYDHAEGLLKSDPGLLYYITHKIVAAGGFVPADFRADPRIEWPLLTDIPALETVGQEFLVAWAALLLGPEVPLHMVAVVVMSLSASMAVVGIIGLTWELTRSARWAALAALLYLVCIANYRTVGFILIREDFCLPLYATHLWLLARAARTRTPAALAAAALSLAASVATWHAMQFIATIEVACVYAWFLRRSQNPLAARGAALGFGLLVAVCVLVPVLFAKHTYASPLVALLFSLVAVAAIERRWSVVSGYRRRVALGLVLAGLVIGRLAGSGKDYSHVYALLVQKVLHLGVMPADPTAIGFEARVLWQGPFASASFADVLYMIGPLAVLLIAGIVASAGEWWAQDGRAEHALLGAFALASVIGAMLIERLYTITGMLAPVIAVLFVRALPRRAVPALVLGVVLVQATVFGDMLRDRQLRAWYRPDDLPVLESSLAWINDHLDPSGAIASDFVSSGMLLANTRHATVVQPKYETLRSRERIERMFEAFFQGSTEQLRALISRDFRARYFLLNAPAMWSDRYAGGLPVARVTPLRGTSADAFLSSVPGIYSGIPGFKLVYEAPARGSWLRIYEVQAR